MTVVRKQNGVILHLLGPAGVGKLSLGRNLAGPLNAKVVDNQLIKFPIFSLLDNDRTTPFPSAVWPEIDKIRGAVLETVARISPSSKSFIFTNELYDDDENDREVWQQVMRAALTRSSPYIPIRLTCSADELARRIVAPERAERLKSMDDKAARRNALRVVARTGTDFEFSLDTTTMTQQEVVTTILSHVDLISR